MKKIILTIALVIGMMTSCKKEVITPNCPVTPTPDKGLVLETNFITNYLIPNDTFYALQFRENGGADHFFINPCGETSINTTFNSVDETRVEVYKNGDGTSNFVWMGTVKVNPADSSFIITKIGGEPGTILISDGSCDNKNKLVILD